MTNDKTLQLLSKKADELITDLSKGHHNEKKGRDLADIVSEMTEVSAASGSDGWMCKLRVAYHYYRSLEGNLDPTASPVGELVLSALIDAFDRNPPDRRVRLAAQHLRTH